MVDTIEQAAPADVEMQSLTPVAATWGEENKVETSTEKLPSSAIVTSDFQQI